MAGEGLGERAGLRKSEALQWSNFLGQVDRVTIHIDEEADD
jgi:hypothetical protein